MELDIFEPRMMLEAVRQRKPVQRHFLDRYFSRVRTFETLSVDIDIWKDKRRIAPFANPLSEGQTVDSIGYITKNFRPPYMKPKMRTTAQELLKRPAGQHLYAPVNPLQRGAEKLGEDLGTLDDMISRREEHMALRALQDGSYTVTGEGVARTIEFDFESDHLVTLSGTDLWTHADSDPINDLLVWRRRVLRHYGYAPTDVYLGNGAAKAFLANTKVRALFNLWNIDPGKIAPSVADNMIHYGYIQAIGMSVHNINEFFIDPADGVEKEMLDDGRCLLMTQGLRAARYYGAIQVVDGLVAVPRFPMSWIEKDPSVRWVQLHSAALPAIEQPDAILSATVI